MSETVTLTPENARDLIHGALTGAGLAADKADYFTDSILETELWGLDGHGFFWLEFYCQHLLSGKVDGRADPSVEALSDVAFRVDACHGFAHPAIEAGFRELIPAARARGVAAMGVYNSYNAGSLGIHTDYLARAGLVALGVANAVPNIAPVGGNTPVIGTNPISFAVPGETQGEVAFIIDQSASAVAWTAVKRAADSGEPIPPGWALDAEGRDTTDAAAGLAGSMAPAGGAKGFSIGLIVEVLCAAVAGGELGTAMGSFTDDDGRPVDSGQFFIAIEPRLYSGGVFDARVAALAESITAQEGARLPHQRRAANKARLARDGLTLDRALHDRLVAFRR